MLLIRAGETRRPTLLLWQSALDCDQSYIAHLALFFPLLLHVGPQYFLRRCHTLFAA